jgi:hypothetical protein
MARRVFVHIGLPKTGTTYLQTIAWSDREALRRVGLLLPGRERRDHLWASCVVRDDPNVGRRDPRAPEAWDVLREEIAAWDGDALVSHEFFASASREQAARMVAQLAPAEVHVVVTARDFLGLFTASWQESLKNGGTTPIEEYARSESEDPLVIWDWRCLDLGLVLERWADAVPADQVHVITLPGSDAPRSELWDRFCGVLGIDPATCSTEGNFPNESMGVVEAETLRRVNGTLDGFRTARDRGVWIRSFLSDERLVPRRGERYWPPADQVADARRRATRAVELVRERGVDVVGDLETLVPAEVLPERRLPGSVTDGEVAAVATELVGVLLGDVRRLTQENRRLRRAERRGGAAPVRGRAARLLARVRRR